VSCTTLRYNSVSLVIDSTGISVQPHFNCPACSEAKAKAWFTIPKTVAVASKVAPIKYPYNFNGLVEFKVPAHTSATTAKACLGKDQVIRLFVAVHQENAKDAPMVWIQRSDAEGAAGIPANWWQKVVAQ